MSLRSYMDRSHGGHIVDQPTDDEWIPIPDSYPPSIRVGLGNQMDYAFVGDELDRDSYYDFDNLRLDASQVYFEPPKFSNSEDTDAL